PIEGTTMKYAVNTAYEVVLADGIYYCCNRGIWFMAMDPAAPWQVGPVTPPNVGAGYTGGYCGEYVAPTGALGFGAGLLTGMALADAWYPCTPCYYSYGCAAAYYPAYGCYCRRGS